MTDKLPQAISESILDIGGSKIRCYVLEDGRRIFNAEDIHRFFGDLLVADLEPTEFRNVTPNPQDREHE